MSKTRKLICNVTGKQLFAAKAYYEKKVEKAGSEEILHNTYICKEAKDLLKKGYNIQETRTTLNVDTSIPCDITDDDVRDLICKDTMRINTTEAPKLGVIKTDPDVAKFIKSLIEDI
jgi:hypothetical protein